MRWCPEGKVTEMLVYKSSSNWKNHKSLKWWNYQAIWSGAWAMCSVVSQKNLARKSQPCWLLPWILLQRRMQCAWRGQKIISCLVWSTFGSLAGPLLIWPCMERGKPTLHMVSQLIHSLVSQLQRATPLVNIQSVLLAKSQSHPKNLPLFWGGGRREMAASETLLDFCKNVAWKVLYFLILCLCCCLKKHFLYYSLGRKGSKNLPLGFSFSFYSHFTVE